LYNREGVEGIDIGFAFLPQFEGMGYGTEAATCLMHAAYNQFGISTLKGICNKENDASKKLLIKLGFRFSGTTTLGDSPEELLLYKINLAKAPDV
jgi:RimJ/RimL family protein N-acetyltransferase